MNSQPAQDQNYSNVVCESCGARHCVLQKDGRYICQSCGWVQRQRRNPDSIAPPRKRRTWLFALLLILVGGGLFGWRYLHRPAPAAATQSAASTSSASTSAASSVPDTGNRQITVQNPTIRVIDTDLDWTLAELLGPALPTFDTSKLELGRFEQIPDETGLPTFRALLTNRSTDMVVLKPVMDLRLFSTDGSTQVPESIGGLPPSLYPGEKAWIKIGDNEDIKPIARVEVTWHASRAVPLPGPRRQANIEVKNNQLHDCHERIINGQGDYQFTYQCVDMTGVIHNTDTRKMELVGVAAFYYDGAGRYVGSETTDLHATLNPGEQVDYEISTKLLRKHGYARYELHYYNQ